MTCRCGRRLGHAPRLVDTMRPACDGRRVVPCVTRTPEPHERGEFPMTCYSCHVYADS